MRRSSDATALGGPRGSSAARPLAALVLAASVALPGIADADGEKPEQKQAAKKADPREAAPAIPWRRDPSVKRHPGSYIGGAVGYARTWAWIPKNDQHADLAPGPFDAYGIEFGVGDAFAEWFALGFRIQLASGWDGDAKFGSFGLVLDTTFYPWGGLGLRPSFGFGFAYAEGAHEWETGGGGPGCLAFALLYEVRLGRLLTLAPIAQVSWIAGEGFDGLVFFAGLEITKWFLSATK